MSQSTSPELHELWWREVPTQWPLRLLHIPTMTSIERTGDHTYGMDKKPEYCVLTYTWGRFRADWGSPALDVKGTTWKIPPVKSSCFTIEAFCRVLQLMRYETDYAWVDIACIDQENNDVKMYEVGRQIGIFKGAKKAFVWLHSLSNIDLKSLLHTLLGYYLEADMENFDFQNVAAKLQTSLKKLFDDPWFTSLWTLQESFLRRDAIMLSCDALSVPHPWIDDLEVDLAMLGNACANICLDAQRRPKNMALKPERHEAQGLVSVIEKAGFQFRISSNPNVQYAAAGFRETTFPLDRIYGIMQIYGIAVGEAAERGRIINSVEELEDEFTTTLNERSPLLGQSFVHINSPVKGRSWRITQQSRVPYPVIGNESSGENAQTNCTIMKSPTDSAAILTGTACSLQRVVQIWQRVPLIDYAYGAEVMLDYDAIVLSHRGEDFDEFDFDYSYSKLITSGSKADDYEACKRLISIFPVADLQVVLLGTNLWGHSKWFFGLIVLQDACNAGWRRMGVCCWNIYPPTVSPIELPVWEEIKFALY